jgi:cytochrome c-type biogenesis protein CcmH
MELPIAHCHPPTYPLNDAALQERVSMSGQGIKRLDLSTGILCAAAVLALVSIGVAMMRGGESAKSQAAASAAADDPIAALQARVAERPADAPAWQALGEAHFARGTYAEAIAALEKATKLTPDKAIAWSALGEARVMASTRDPMPAQALADFRRAQAADPKDPRSRYFLAVKRDLDGDHQGAIADWLALLKDTPPGAPWRDDLKRTIEQVGSINKIDVAARLAAAEAATAPPAPALPGPSAEDLAAVKSIPPGEQRQMAEGMVARLEARLKTDPNNVEGWMMLIRSRAHLEQADKASAALKQAVAANPGEAAALQAAAAQLGVR